jgi:hypothetical protein
VCENGGGGKRQVLTRCRLVVFDEEELCFEVIYRERFSSLVPRIKALCAPEEFQLYELLVVNAHLTV